MPKFSFESRRRLETCDSRLIRVFETVLSLGFDHTIVTGHRSEREQEEMFRLGRSKLLWPNSRHNTMPAEAVDAAPYPIDWKDRERFSYFAGVVLGIAQSQGLQLTWGGDWDRDWQLRDNTFDDLLHFELPREPS
jgi:peptidoglycan L-alanyl-D-glutamate endopeptidase CwlK